MSFELPPPLRASLDRALQGAPRAALAERAARIFEAYRDGRGSGGVIRDADDALAYGLTRLPATFAACRAAFEATRRRAPDFAPRTLLDAGVGPGAASWAAAETWPGLAGATWLDESAPFLALARTLAADGPPALASADTRRGDLATAGASRADLVVASYALAEVATARQADAAAALWAACAGVLVLVEPGTPDGYQRLITARDGLIADGALVLAPCPHALPCPLSPPDWCHFAQRLARSRDQRLAKGGGAPFEDEKFAYLAVARPGVAAAAPAARVLARPRLGKPGMALKLCTPQGQAERRLVARRDRAALAAVRRLDWGDDWQG